MKKTLSTLLALMICLSLVFGCASTAFAEPAVGKKTVAYSMVNSARTHRPKLLIGLDLRANRRALGQQFGCDLVFNPAQTDVVHEIMARTDGYGADVYIEAAGNERSVNQGLALIRNLGRFVQFGVFPDAIRADWNIIGDTKEIDILGAHLGPYCYGPVIKGMEDGSILTEGVVTHTFALSDWQRAFETAEKDENAIKVALIP